MTPTLSKGIEDELKFYAKTSNIDLAVLVGIVLTESSGRWVAKRYEKGYRWLWDVERHCPFHVVGRVQDFPPPEFKGILGVSTPEHEWTRQRTSYGPMQVMGAVARELGFTKDLEELNGPPGLLYGVKHLKNLRDRFMAKHTIEGVISAYNCGQPKPDTNPDYVHKVKDFASWYRLEKLK